jgi:hypothetical protein
MPINQQKDLVVLTEGKNDVETIKALLNRYQSLQIRQISFDIYDHPQSGPGCLQSAHSILSSSNTTHRYALVIFDRVGCGQDNTSPNLEKQVETDLEKRGWGNRVRAIVIDPELEIWAWSSSPHVEKALGWTEGRPAMRSFLQEKALWEESATKPFDKPKEAFEAVLRATRTPFSSSIHSEIARTVSMEHCQDTSFIRFKSVLQTWFGPES